MALAVSTSSEISSPEAIFIYFFHGEKVIFEDCEINLLVIHFLPNSRKILANCWVFDIKVSFLDLKESENVTDKSICILSVPVCKIESPSYHHIVKLVGVCHILHTLDEFLPKGSIKVELIHEVSSHLRGIKWIPIEGHGNTTWNNIRVIHQVSE